MAIEPMVATSNSVPANSGKNSLSCGVTRRSGPVVTMAAADCRLALQLEEALDRVLARDVQVDAQLGLDEREFRRLGHVGRRARDGREDAVG